ncbi:MAG: hypothetical protein KJZ74_15440 [Gemmatimonadales bacterium]|nr:hypothetical protein [Gemmatimonadota bacterium]MCL4215298.1 hypothetical protein [Gemmatimonadales bacterium]
MAAAAAVRMLALGGALVATVLSAGSCYVARAAPPGGVEPASRIRLESRAGLMLHERRADGTVSPVGCRVNVVDGTLVEVQSRSFLLERVVVRRPRRAGPGCDAPAHAQYLAVDAPDIRVSRVQISDGRTILAILGTPILLLALLLVVDCTSPDGCF